MNYSTVRVKYEYSRTSSSTVRVREGGYSYGTVPALFTIRFGRAETVPVLVRVRSRGILFEIQYGTRTVQYSTIAYFLQYKIWKSRNVLNTKYTAQSRTRTSTSKRGA